MTPRSRFTPILLIAALTIALSMPIAALAVQLEGSVQAVNRDVRSLSLLRKTKGGDKTDVFDVDSKAGDLSGLNIGDTITASYDPESEKITGFTVTGAAPTASMPANDATKLNAKEFQSHRYKFFPEVMTWIAAKQRCESMGGHLAVLDSPGEAEFVLRIVQASGTRFEKMDGVWIGATDNKVEGEWVWVDGSPMRYADWFRNQPNNKKNEEHYAMLWISAGKWCDQPNSSIEHTTYFVCEWDN
jgi:hypothetical protein